MITNIFISLCLFHSIFGYFLFPELPIGVPGPLDSKCNEDNEIFLNNLYNLSLWAYQMMDASGKAPKGVLQGNLFSLGNFDECVHLEAPIETKYCLVRINAENVPVPDPPRSDISLEYLPNESVLRKMYVNQDEAQQRRDYINIGWCIPASCSSSHLEKNLNKYLESKDHNLKKYNISFKANVNENLCQTKPIQEYGIGEIIFCFISACLITLVIVATCMDYYCRKTEDKRTNQISQIFSAISSFNELADVKYDQGLATLNGIKFLSFIPVFIAHLICIGITLPTTNVDYIEKLAKSIPVMMFLNGSLFIDGFFVISAFLLIYKLLDKKQNLSIWILIRYVSLTPSLAYIVFFYATMLKHMGSGPLWTEIIGPEVNDCVNNWWASILYLSNYVNSDHLCMLQTWYVDCDFHFFIIGIIIISLYQKNPMAAKLFGAFTLFASVAVSFAYIYVNELELINSLAIRLISRIKGSSEFAMAYQTSHVRASPYIVGLFGGYLYVKLKKNDTKFSNLKSNIIYLISSIFLIMAMFSGVILYNTNIYINPFFKALYTSTYRLIWALGTLGMILCINFGNAYLLKNVLSWKPFVPLSKLIYGAYLCHLILILRSFGIIRTPQYYDIPGLFALMGGYVIYSFIISLGLYICIEAPIKNIYRILTSHK